MEINRSLVSLPVKSKQLLDEPDSRVQYNPDSTISDQHKGKGVQGIVPDSEVELYITLMKEDMEDLDGVSRGWVRDNFAVCYKKYLEYQYMTLESLGVSHDDVDKESPSPWRFLFQEPETNWYKLKGVPQGAPTSPFVASLALSDFYSSIRTDRPRRRAIGYADD